MTEEPPLLTVERFGRRYSRSRPWALRRATLSFPNGSITALVGPNGAGKSTLIRACLGFERADEGQILVGGHNPHRSRAAALNLISYVPQTVNLYRGLTIGDHLQMAASARPGQFDLPYAKSLIGAVGLTIDLAADQLSGGERVQVALAMALAVKAPLMLLDEPQASLDPLARGEFFRTLVHELRTRNGTALVSSHVISDLENSCDRLVVLGGGRVLIEIPVADALARFRTLPAADAKDDARVGVFLRPTGEAIALIDRMDHGSPATFEDVVLGHLARSKSGPGAAH